MTSIVYTITCGSLIEAAKLESLIEKGCGRITNKRFGHARGNGSEVTVGARPKHIIRRKRWTVEDLQRVYNNLHLTATSIATLVGRKYSTVWHVIYRGHPLEKEALRGMGNAQALANKLALIRARP